MTHATAEHAGVEQHEQEREPRRRRRHAGDEQGIVGGQTVVRKEAAEKRARQPSQSQIVATVENLRVSVPSPGAKFIYLPDKEQILDISIQHQLAMSPSFVTYLVGEAYGTSLSVWCIS